MGMFLFSLTNVNAYVVAYGEQIVPQKLLSFNNTGTSSWNVLTTNDSFSYNVVNGYRIGFGMGAVKFYNISINITNPLEGANITWYYTNCGTSSCTYTSRITAFTPVADTCNNFSTTGNCYIEVNPDLMPNWNIQRGGTNLPPTADTGNNGGTGIYVMAHITKNATADVLTADTIRLNLDAVRIDEGEFTQNTLASNLTALGNNDCINIVESYYNMECDLVMGRNYVRNTTVGPSTVNFTINNNTLFELGGLKNYRVFYNVQKNNQLTVGAYNTTGNYTYGGSVFKYNNHFFVDNTYADRSIGDSNFYGSTFILRMPYTNSFAQESGFTAINTNMIMTDATTNGIGFYLLSTSSGIIKNVFYQTVGNKYILFYSGAMDIQNFVFNNVQRMVMGTSNAEIKNTNLEGLREITAVNTNPKVYVTDCAFTDSTYSQVVNTSGVNTNVTVRYNTTIDIYDVNGSLMPNNYFNVSMVNALGTTIRSGVWNGSQMTDVYRLHSINASYSTKYNYNPITIKITAPNMIDYQIVTNITNSNRHMTFSQVAYPLTIVNKSIVVSRPNESTNLWTIKYY